MKCFQNGNVIYYNFQMYAHGIRLSFNMDMDVQLIIQAYLYMLYCCKCPFRKTIWRMKGVISEEVWREILHLLNPGRFALVKWRARSNADWVGLINWREASDAGRMGYEQHTYSNHHYRVICHRFRHQTWLNEHKANIMMKKPCSQWYRHIQLPAVNFI